MAPLLIGLFIFTAAVAIGPASGGSFNPHGQSTRPSSTVTSTISGSTSSGRSSAA